MRFAHVSKIVVVGIAALMICVASAMAQQVHFFPDFSSGTSNLQMNGSAHVATYQSAKVLRLTDGYPGIGTFHPETSAAWFKLAQAQNLGFTTYFRFQIHTAAICCTPADGFAFVIQNSSPTALGTGNGGLGYAGIRDSVAIEFDTYQNPWDPSPNHVAVQSCGTGANAPQHIVGNCLVPGGLNSNPTAVPHLGVTCGTSGPCTDGVPHDVVVEYDPPVSGVGNGTLTVWIDPAFVSGTHTPVSTAVKAINIPYNINNTQNSQGISLANGTAAWVGFTASQTSDPQAHDILAWEFSVHAPAQVQQMLPSCQTDVNGNCIAPPPAVTFNFGANDTVVNEFCDPANLTTDCFMNNPNDPYLMTVVATPTTPSAFHTRLAGTQFDREQCIVYQGTGGKCMVYSITCQLQSNPTQNVTCPASLPNTCNNIGDPGCIVYSTSFYTLENVTPTNADYLKADPIGSNNWISIFQMYQPNIFDGRTTGTGSSSSDFVATYNPTLP
ncbi:MAG: L-type lectin-domain containing protein [Candidatus Korobacteraceae bacterium]